ncbi:MFS transporter [Streptomyces sp. NPDC052721]|uniref:MFS transporter n=1 Tax=Streptomyces sp. NPDC052721 TaxID=3154955 RepID=UPI0034178E59
MSTATSGRTTKRPTIILAAVCVAVLILPASLTGSSVALPDIASNLDAGLVPLQWVVNAYNLAFASFMLACGSLADIVGRRRMFAIGTAVFALASLGSGLSGDVLLLDVLRGVAGLGAAAVMTSGCAILATTFEGAALGRAFAVLGSSAGAGLALGPSLSGLLVGTLGWRWVFLAHAVVAAVVLLALPAIPESRNSEGARVDWWGTVTFTASLFLLMLGVVQGPQIGWASAEVIALFVGAVLLIALFTVVESRQAHPMFDLALFRQSRFLAVCLLPVAIAFGFVCLLVLLPSWFSGANGQSADAAGATMMLLTLPVLVVPLGVNRLVKRGMSTRAVLSLSLLLVALGGAWLTVLHPGIPTWQLAGPLLLIGIGMGFSAGLIDGVAVTSVAPERAGMAAGMFNTMRLAGEAVAITVMSTVMVSLLQSRVAQGLHDYGRPSSDAAGLANRVASGDLTGAAHSAAPELRDRFSGFLADSYTGAMHSVLWLLAAICAVTTVVVYLMLRDPQEATTDAPTAEDTVEDPTAQETTVV